MCSGYSTENGIYAPLLQSFLQLSSGPDGGMLTLYEDSTVKIIPVALAKDGMQLKPGMKPLHANSHILLQTGHNEQLTSITGISFNTDNLASERH